MPDFPASFLRGDATAPHQIEGNDLKSDWWAYEGVSPGMEPSGDAVDSYHGYREDMRLLADAGLNAYRLGIEWVRIEPREGRFAHAELAHYRRMIDTAVEFGLTPAVTLHHFTVSRWFAEDGGWSPSSRHGAVRLVRRPPRRHPRRGEWVVTMNEPNMLAMMTMVQEAIRSGGTRAVAEPDRRRRGGS